MEVLNKEKVLEYAKQLVGEGKVEKAIIEYKRLLEIDPKDMRVKIRIAELLARQKKITEAVKVYNEVADSYTDDGFFLKAVTVYKNILRFNPSLIDVNYKLAEIYGKMGLLKDAFHQYQILASTLEQKNDYEGLVNVRKKMVELDSHNIPNRIRLAETYQYRGMEAEAIDEYEKLIDEIKGTGKTEQLIELYEKILSYRQDNLVMIRDLCHLYYRRGEWKKLLSQLEKKEEIFEAEAELILMQAEVYARLNQNETAKGRFKKAAAVLIDSGELEKAFDAYREVLVITLDDEDVREALNEIDPDLFEKLAREAAEKRKMLEDRAVSEEEEGAEDKVAEGVWSPELSEDEVSRKLKEGDSAFELGKAYHQMGLESESKPELNKALGIYRELVGSGYHDDKVTEKVLKIEEWLGFRAEEEETVDMVRETVDVKQETKDQRLKTEDRRQKTEDQRPKTKPMTNDQRLSTKKEKKKEDNKKKDKKKRDKRVGFV